MEREQAQKFMHELLRVMVSRRASDLFITVGFPPAIKVDGKLTPVSNQTLTPQHTIELSRAIMTEKQQKELKISGVQLCASGAGDRAVSLQCLHSDATGRHRCGRSRR
jgi:Tfp pilus assembly ATPase PilU